MNTLFALLMVPLAAAGLAWLICWGLLSFLLERPERHGTLDHPNERSSHQEPTPRIGGIGWMAGIAVVLALWPVLSDTAHKFARLSPPPVDHLRWWGLLGAVAVAFVVGLVDDRRGLPPVVKLLGQFVAAGIAVGCGLRVLQVHLPNATVMALPPLVGGAIAFVWIVLVMNAVNFMDGINGLAARMGMAASMSFLVMSLNALWMLEVTVIAGALGGASYAFFGMNFPRARTFFGDAGSQALGAFIGVVVLYVASNDIRATWSGEPYHYSFGMAALVVAVFVFDVLFTLGRRLARGQNPLRAHREHLYQRYLIARGEDHVETTFFVGRWVVGCAIVAGFATRFTNPAEWQWRAVAISAVAIILLLYYVGVRRAEKRTT